MVSVVNFVAEYDSNEPALGIDPEEIGFDIDPEEIGFDIDPEEIGFDIDPEEIGFDIDPEELALGTDMDTAPNSFVFYHTATNNGLNNSSNSLANTQEDPQQVKSETEKTGIPAPDQPSQLYQSNVVDKTIDPYGYIRQDAYQIRMFFANRIFASVLNSGPLSEDMSEEGKKYIRIALTLSITIAFSVSSSIVVAWYFGQAGGVLSGISVCIGASNLISSQLEDVYDIKKRQEL